MTQKKIKRIIRPATAEERQRHAVIRREGTAGLSAIAARRAQGITSRHRGGHPAGTESQGLTWYALAKLAGIPNPNTVRDIEYGHDAQLSNVQAVAEALGLRLELAIK